MVIEECALGSMGEVVCSVRGGRHGLKEIEKFNDALLAKQI